MQKTGEKYWEEVLIHNYANIKLVDRVECHKRACQFYLSLQQPETRTKKEDIQPLIEAYYHACMAKEYDIAAHIIFYHKLFDDLDRWGNYRTLVELYVGVLPKNHLKDKPLIFDLKLHILVLGTRIPYLFILLLPN